MSKTSLTAAERLAFAKWAHDLGLDPPTIPQAASWIEEHLGKVVPENTVRGLVKRTKYAKRLGTHFHNDGELDPLVRPGFGAEITSMLDEHEYLGWRPNRWAFPIAVLDWEANTLTWLELAMMWFIEQITNKPNWHVKIFDDEIVAKWKAEVMRIHWADVDLKYAAFNEDMFVYCLKELREKAKLYEAAGLVPVFDATAAVVKSDCAVPLDLKQELKEAAAVLEDVPDQEKDWHPGSDGKVLDLVHPSLWPLTYGVSRIVADKRISVQDALESCGTGEVLPVTDENLDSLSIGHLMSAKFQWLPCDVDLDDDRPRITSYINNLHPRRHLDLYAVIEKIIGKTLPLWDVVYRWPTKFKTQRIKPIMIFQQCLTEEICQGDCWPSNRPKEPDEDDDDDDDDSDTLSQRDIDWFDVTHPAEKPDVEEYTPMKLQPESITLKNDFFKRAERIQVIVKLANIHLTPEKPTYEGGSWHIEGQLNERICATALYYYDNDNITDSRLAFRTQANREPLKDTVGYEFDEFQPIRQTFKIDTYGNTLQDLGSVLTREDRLLAFPNVYQHRVEPFELADKTRPGHRKILAMFLVDPATPIISTANVPPQQKHWWREAVAMSPRLPPEVADMVADNLDFPIGIDKAKEMRLEVMEERKAISDANMGEVNSAKWNFCEH